jgi:hypothetical protein
LKLGLGVGLKESVGDIVGVLVGPRNPGILGDTIPGAVGVKFEGGAGSTGVSTLEGETVIVLGGAKLDGPPGDIFEGEAGWTIEGEAVIVLGGAREDGPTGATVGPTVGSHRSIFG